MSNISKSNMRKRIKSEETILRKIVNLYDPLGLCCHPEDEYDDLVHNLISLLHRGGEDLETNVFDLLKGYSDEQLKSIHEMAATTKEILKWWDYHKANLENKY